MRTSMIFALRTLAADAWLKDLVTSRQLRLFAATLAEEVSATFLGESPDELTCRPLSEHMTDEHRRVLRAAVGMADGTLPAGVVNHLREQCALGQQRERRELLIESPRPPLSGLLAMARANLWNLCRAALQHRPVEAACNAITTATHAVSWQCVWVEDVRRVSGHPVPDCWKHGALTDEAVRKAKSLMLDAIPPFEQGPIIARRMQSHTDGLARACREEGSDGPWHVLADAIEDDAQLSRTLEYDKAIEHLHSQGLHTDSCWVLSWLLGRGDLHKRRQLRAARQADARRGGAAP